MKGNTDADPPRASPSSAHLRLRYLALLQGDPVIDEHNRRIESSYDRWRELKRMVIVYGLPRDEGIDSWQAVPSKTPRDPTAVDDEVCSLRGRIWKAFLGVEDRSIDRQKYRELIARGASHYDGDIRNDTFRTFRGDAKFADRVPEHKLVRLLNAFFNELGASSSEAGELCEFPNYFRYVQGMNVLCAPLLYIMPEEDAYHTFCQLVVRHCPKYLAPQLRGVERGCILVDQCLELIDPELFRHLNSVDVTARIYALPYILSLFACVPPLPELLHVWDVLFAVGVHFVVLLAVAHTVLLRDQLLKKKTGLMNILSSRFAPPLESEKLVSVALQLLHQLPDELLYEISRHPLENPDLLSSLPLTQEAVEGIQGRMQIPRSPKKASHMKPPSQPTLARSMSTDTTKKKGSRDPVSTTVAAQYVPRFFSVKPPWKC